MLRSLASAIASRWCLGVLMFGMIIMTSCSKDVTIIDDYKLYDLDGSNQAIIGGSGMVKVSDVTAYNIEGKNIYFETGAINTPIEESAGNRSDSCRYGFIDTTEDVIVPAPLGSSLRKSILNRLTAESKGIVYRSCVSQM